MIHRDSVTVKCVLSFPAPRLFSLANNDAKRPLRFRSDSNAVPEWSQTGALIALRRAAPIRLLSRQRGSRLASLQLVQRMIAARASTRYSVTQRLVPGIKAE